MMTKPVVFVQATLTDENISDISQYANVVLEPWKLTSGKMIPPDKLVANPNAEILLTWGSHRGVDETLKRIPSIKWIHSLSAGVSQLLTDTVIRSDIVVTNSKGCTAVPIAEYVLSWIFALTKEIPQFIRQKENKTWKRRRLDEVGGKTLLILGYGSIGREIAKRAKGMGMNVTACKRNVADDPFVDIMVEPKNLVSVLSQTDFLVDCLPESKETFQLINRDILNQLKPTSYVINVGRGSTINEQDLMQAVQSKRIAGAVLDVFGTEPLPAGHPFWETENIFITPHNSFSSPRVNERLIQLFIDNLIRYINKEPMMNVVDKQSGY